MKETILVTGGAGYIGSCFVRSLANSPEFADYTIRIYDNLYRQRYAGLMDLPKNGKFEFVEGDILDRLNLDRVMRGAKTVVHLAAVVRSPLSFEHPEWTEQVNHWGTASVVECALRAGVSRFLFASSASVYGVSGLITYKEGDPCQPVGPYPTSKLRAEEAVKQASERGLKTTTIRIGNVFGNAPAMRFDGFISRSVYLAGVGRPIVVHGSGDQIRPAIHIEDAAAAIRFCLTHAETENDIINAVSINPTVNEIATNIQGLAPTSKIRYTDQELLTEVSFGVDSSKLLQLGFEPQYDLQQGVWEMLARFQSLQPAFGR
ncbi:NAD(P)-dependent oxidoreductase [Anaerolineales bacterium HSG6]|nr:NAD(P)-dependent oxidoreductase [Anaerolineales bacterium HSG6]